MRKYDSIGQFGTYILASGIGMVVAVGCAFLIGPIGNSLGNSLPYVISIIVLLQAIAVMIFVRSFPRNVTIPIGVAGWLVSMIALLLHGLL